jgi:putative inorganic carbon (HCO3(-)) transporter
MDMGFNIYLLFIASWFLHLSSRLVFLGEVRFDLLLVGLIFIIICGRKKNEDVTSLVQKSETNKYIRVLILYIIFTVPLVEWPGSVLHVGIENFIKSVSFYFFTIYLVTTEEKLKRFILFFIICQSLRIIEPVYLHITQGYWGSFASMAGWEYMYRLSGAPSDVVNPNGLAFIILTVLPFILFHAKLSIMNRVAAVFLVPLFIYALLLTGSRSGLVGLFIICICTLMKSKNKILLILLLVAGTVVSINFMGDNLTDRYKSIIYSDTKNAATAEGRIEGVKRDLMVALRRPLFGHGLGTSRETNANFGGEDKPSHNLYTETAQELGFIGFVIFMMLINSIIGNFNKSITELRSLSMNESYLYSTANALQVWLYVNIVFSFASYGLSSYEWYLFAGMSIMVKIIVGNLTRNGELATC